MKKIALIFIIVLLGLAACSTPRLVKVEEEPDPTATATLAANEIPTEIPTENPTEIPTDIPTEIPEPTNAAVPEPTEIPEVVPTIEEPPASQVTIPVGSILMEDYFDSDDGTWNLGFWENDAGFDTITDGEYQMTIQRDEYMLWSETFDLGSDLVMEVDTRLVDDSLGNGHGFVCRYVDEYNFYFLTIGNDGYYSIDKYVNDVYENLAADYAPEGIIDPVQNHIQAQCVGTTLTLVANGYLLAEVEDDSLSSGLMALYLRSNDEPESTIAFDNLFIYAPGEEVPGMLQNGELVFEDKFDSDKGVWSIGDFETYNVQLANGSLTYTMKNLNWNAWDYLPDQEFEDVALEASFENVDLIGDADQGFVCRYQDSSNYYMLSYRYDNYVSIYALVDSEYTSLYKGYVDTDVIQMDVNTAKAVCEGNQLSLYVNGDLMAQAVDPNNTFPIGKVGFVMGSSDTSDVKISIDYFKVFKLD
ncbi:MAG: PT domain-containing protein [Anaerolineaceae bacterium]|jgi:hypothetical protein|nr:PT domain-containing protein [Anaerolineaceae bacterium]